MKTFNKFLMVTSLTLMLAPANIVDAVSLKKGLDNIVQIGSALLVQGTAHEMGHRMVADSLDAKSSNVKFFTTKDGNFFFGLNTSTGIKEKSWVSYRMSGFVFSNMTYEYALTSYRQNPTTFNQALALLSASDFFKYSFFALYIGDSDVDEYDPAYVHKKTGFSKESILLTSLAQALINTYRLYSGDDTVIPFVVFKGDHNDNSVLVGFTIKY